MENEKLRIAEDINMLYESLSSTGNIIECSYLPVEIITKTLIIEKYNATKPKSLGSKIRVKKIELTKRIT